MNFADRMKSGKGAPVKRGKVTLRSKPKMLKDVRTRTDKGMTHILSGKGAVVEYLEQEPPQKIEVSPVVQLTAAQIKKMRAADRRNADRRGVRASA